MTWESQLPVVFQGSFDTQIDRLFDEALHAVSHWKGSWTPGCNVYEDDQSFVVQMALPGMDANDINVRTENSTLFVNGERKSDGDEKRTWYAHQVKDGTFACSFQLPSSIDQGTPMASYKQGILTITFPKREEAKPRQIMIESQ